MEFVFSLVNSFVLILGLVSALVLYFYACDSYQEQVASYVKNDGTTLDAHKKEAHKRTDRFFNKGLAVIALISVLGMIAYVPFRIEEIRSETAIVALSNRIAALSETRLGERCAFNGALVSETWIATDTFPCKSVGNFRIWANGWTSSADAVSVSRKFSVGRIDGENSVQRLFTVNFDRPRRGIKGTVAEFDTALDTDGVLDLTRQLGGQ
jgi:hypothetical protein